MSSAGWRAARQSLDALDLRGAPVRAAQEETGSARRCCRPTTPRREPAPRAGWPATAPTRRRRTRGAPPRRCRPGPAMTTSPVVAVASHASTRNPPPHVGRVDGDGVRALRPAGDDQPRLLAHLACEAFQQGLPGIDHTAGGVHSMERSRRRLHTSTRPVVVPDERAADQPATHVSHLLRGRRRRPQKSFTQSCMTSTSASLMMLPDIFDTPSVRSLEADRELDHLAAAADQPVGHLDLEAVALRLHLLELHALQRAEL